MDRIVLTQPEVVPEVRVTQVEFWGVTIMREPPLLHVYLSAPNGTVREVRYEGAEATARFDRLNLRGLVSTVLALAVEDSKVDGTVEPPPAR